MLVKCIKTSLKDLQLAIVGEILMTETLQQTMRAMLDAKIPPHWKGSS